MEEGLNSEVARAIEVKEGVIGDLDNAVKSFDAGDINDLGMYAVACNVWKRVNGHPWLKERLGQEMRRRRQYYNAIVGIDILRGDPIKKRYDPNQWLGEMPLEFKGKEGKFIRDRMGSLGNLIGAL